MRDRESGQVLAEAVIVLLLLGGFVWAVHALGEAQVQWQAGWLAVQRRATAVSLGHQRIGQGQVFLSGPIDRSRGLAVQSFKLGQTRWLEVRSNRMKAHLAWRLVGTGQAATDADVVRRIEVAPTVWRDVAVRSQGIVARVAPTLVSVDAPWGRTAQLGRWLRGWQGSVPSSYLRRQLPAAQGQSR